MSNEYILFFSKNCSYCTDLLNKLYKNDDILKQIVLINVNNRQLKIPSFIKSVPSLIVNENNNQHLLVGTEIFKWFDEIIKSKQNEIADWDPTTMAGMSDDFSFIEDKDTVNNDRSYCFLDNANNFKINTPKDNSSTEKQNRKSNTDMSLDKLLEMRKRDMPKPVERR